MNEFELNKAVCRELGLHHVTTTPQGLEAWRCQVLGFEALVLLAVDGWHRCWPRYQEPIGASTFAFGPTKLEEVLCIKA